MPKYHLKVDWRNGDTVYVGKSGREVAGDTLEVLEASASAGDVDAAAVLRDLDMSVDAEGHPHSDEATLATSMALLDACPDCAAEREAAARLSGELSGHVGVGRVRLDHPGDTSGLAYAGSGGRGVDPRGGGSARTRAADRRARAVRRRKAARAARAVNRRGR
ncbi:MAG: hypothetical protein R3B06_30940 [Kofleriaceae bacterium]